MPLTRPGMRSRGTQVISPVFPGFASTLTLGSITTPFQG